MGRQSVFGCEFDARNVEDRHGAFGVFTRLRILTPDFRCGRRFDGYPWLRKRDAETAVEAFACEREVSKAEMNPSADRDADPRHTHSSMWRENSVVSRTRREAPARRYGLRFSTEVRRAAGRLR